MPNNNRTVRPINLTEKHKAVCDEHDLNAPWRANEQMAWQDAAEHQRVHNHVVRVITRVYRENSNRPS